MWAAGTRRRGGARPGASSRARPSRSSCPGSTTREDVLRLCGAPSEENEEFAAPARQTLVYRGRRLVPSARRIFGWLSAVRHWEVERQEVKIVLDHDVVGDVQASTRHYRLTADEPE